MEIYNISFSSIASRLTLSVLFGASILLPSALYGQYITGLTADLSVQPNVINIEGAMNPGYIRAISVEEAQLEGDTVVVQVYFKHCSPASVVDYFDTSFVVNSAFPYDLLILTYLDSNTVVAGPQPCYLMNPNIILAHVFFYEAGQLLSTLHESVNSLPKLYPNPVHEKLYLETIKTWSIAKVYSSHGAELFGLLSEAYNGYISLDSLPPGMYLLVLYDEYGKVVGRARFVKI